MKRADLYPGKTPSHVISKATLLELGVEKEISETIAKEEIEENAIIRHDGPFEKSKFFGGQ